MVDGAESITPEQVKASVARGKQYFHVLLNMGPTPRPDEALRGISIYAVDHIEEIKSFLAVDPMIVAGYLSAEIYPWMGMPGDRLP